MCTVGKNVPHGFVGFIPSPQFVLLVVTQAPAFTTGDGE
jgi:hypothetical protein